MKTRVNALLVALGTETAEIESLVELFPEQSEFTVALGLIRQLRDVLQGVQDGN